jgi:hypothetical protein
MTATPPDRRVDELRQELRKLGYLDAGVDRFVLGAARDARRPHVIALLASLRIGLLGALLLGPSAAVGLGGRLPGLVTGPRDAAVVALYLGVVFGAAITVAAFVASMLVAAVSRTSGATAGGRARSVAIATGLVVSIACLGYLTLWWRTANAGLGWSAPVWTAFALAVAAAISLLLGHAVTIAALAVTVSDPGATPMSPGVPGSSWRAQLAAGGLAFAGAAALLIVTAPAEGRETGEPPPLTVVSGGLRVRVYAIDGLDPATLEALTSQFGLRLPTLTAALGGPRAALSAQDWRDPARAWTTLSTGQPPEVHGVHGLETRRVAGLQGSVAAETPSTVGRLLRAATDLIRLTRPAVASGTERRAKALWEVAADAGLRTAVINWWATWPAPASKGIVLSDRATLRLQVGGALDAEIAPPDLYEQLRARWPALTAEAGGRAETVGASAAPEIRALLRRSAELDALQVLLAREVTTDRLDLACTYLPGLDILQQGLGGAGIQGALALPEYYRFLDALLGEAATPGEQELVALVTGPGRGSEAAGALLSLRGAATGPPVRVEGRPADVMPTLLHALGVPISRELAGRPLLDLFAPAFTQRHPVREVATYGSPSAVTAPRAGKPLDQEMIDRLRSLGYVK